MGTTDGYNTETPERLHIDYVKVGYRASKGPDQIPQMARHLQRREALAIVRARLERHGVIPKRQVIWQRDGTFEEFSNDAEDLDGEEDELDGEEDMCPEANEDVVDSADVDAVIGVYRRLLLAKRPPRAVHGLNVMSEFHAPDFIKALRTFLDTYCPHAEFIDFDEHTAFEVWTRLRLIHDELPFAPLVGPKIDRVRAYPGPPNGSRRSVHTRAFDTVLLDAFPDKPGIHRYRAARLRVIFRLPSYYHDAYSGHLAYVELFGQFSKSANRPHRLYEVSPLYRNGHRVAIVVPLNSIRMVCHLVPQYASLDDNILINPDTDLLDISPGFWFNKYSSYYMNSLVDHWQKNH